MATTALETNVVSPDHKKPRFVQVSVTNINQHGVFLTIRDIVTDELIDSALTFDELFARDDVVVSSAYYPLDNEIEPTTINNSRKLIDDLRALSHEQNALREELHSTTNSARYAVLSATDSPIRDLDRKLKVRRMICDVAFIAMFGIRPSEFRDLGLN